MGLDFDSRLFMGRDVFSKEEPFVVFEDKSFITKDIKYYYPNDEVIPINDQDISEDELKAMQQKTDEIFYYSTLILDYDYYSTITWNKEDGKDEVNERKKAKTIKKTRIHTTIVTTSYGSYTYI